MTEYSVLVEAVANGGYLPPEHPGLDALMDRLSDADAVVSAAESPPRYGARFTVHGDDVLDACARAVAMFTEAVAADDMLPHLPIRTVEVTTYDELEADLARPAWPPLVGVAEAAQLLGVSKQRVSTLHREGRLPRPVMQLASGPVWLAAAVHAFGEQWDRRPGRPRKATTLPMAEAG